MLPGLSDALEESELSSALRISLSNGRKTLLRTDRKGFHLPGQPRIQLHGAKVAEYLRNAHLVSELDKLAPYLRFVTTPSSSHILPLHEYATRGRALVITERPGLHLVWYHDKIFLKPIPPYLLCGAFWEYIEEADTEVWKAAAGFMRSYYYLIQYEIDFRKATSSNLQLIPRLEGRDPITFEEFVGFIDHFHAIGDQNVAPRYSYGALRLTRLNHIARIFLHKWTYFHLHPQWSDNLGRVVAPVVTLFAVFATILNSMQVVLAAQGSNGNEVWPEFLSVSKWFAVGVIVMVLLILVGLLVIMVVMLLKELSYAWSLQRELKRGKPATEIRHETLFML